MRDTIHVLQCGTQYCNKLGYNIVHGVEHYRVPYGTLWYSMDGHGTILLYGR